MVAPLTHYFFHRTRPVITVKVSILLPSSINITAPQCHDGTQHVNCANVTVCFQFYGKHVPGEIGKVCVTKQNPFSNCLYTILKQNYFIMLFLKLMYVSSLAEVDNINE